MTTSSPTAPAVDASPHGGARDIVRCRVCGSTDCTDCGPPAYRLPTRVAGVGIDVSDLPLTHQLCRSCSYRFVHPVIPERRLLDCYRRAPKHHWGTEPALAESRFYARKRQLLERLAPGRRVLDFGCYDGGFLQYLGEPWDVAGIEPSEDAAHVAQSRGIRIIGPTVEAVAAGSVEPFDAVVVFDVIEHLNEPVEMLRALSRLLKPGGIVLIETGDTDAPHFARAGKLDPYCGLVEHVGFFNRRSIAEAGRRAGGLELAHFERSVHSQFESSRLRIAAGQALARAYIAAYWTLRSLRAARVPMPRRARDIAAGPIPRTTDALNHFLAVLRKPANEGAA
jgi:SAM-dependent methyltransferase